MSSDEQQKAQGFIHNLLNNPSLQGYTPLQKEEQVRIFLEQNASQLAPTLSSSKFFPGYSRPSIQSLLLQELVTIINNALMSYVQRIIYEQIDYGFLNKNRAEQYPKEQLKDALYKMTSRIAEKGSGRIALTGPSNALIHSIPDRYLDRILQTKNYVRFELEKVQRLKLKANGIKNMIKVSLLLRPAIHILTDRPPLKNHRAGTVATQFADKTVAALGEQMPIILPELLYSGVMSNVSFQENEKVPTTSRITLILSSFSRDYRPNKKVDRGAASPEMSWFNVARKNYKLYGYDRRMLDEFYRIAAENRW